MSSKYVVFVAQLVRISQRGAEQALAQRLDGDDVLAIGQDNARQRDAVLIFMASRITAKASMPALPSGAI